MPSDLNWVESLLYRLITAPSGVAEGLAQEKSLAHGGLARVIAGDDRLSAEERVDIYANMYFYRILDVLKEDFPATLARARRRALSQSRHRLSDRISAGAFLDLVCGQSSRRFHPRAIRCARSFHFSPTSPGWSAH